ncbi:helix-hairpin-helix domain-containing protein [Actinomadura madurae]|uniref:helix-hairpin-helix domain-containing protein n=1 Tax=Actinomadura madurae TaxID=1993 RepID=UPI0020D2087F|nr:helix-hairpin-helix domain-containing protein [Actinomadura madurae]MCP9977097.1 conjugal transfer protein TraA [Actinomadura madurae]
MTDTPDQTPSPAERAARAAEAMRAAEAAADALDRRPAGGPAAGPAPAPPPGPGPAPGEGLRALTALFAETGVPAALAAPAVTRLGPDAAGRLRADPWRLLRVPGVQPRQADHFARALLGEDARPDDPRRGAALVLHLLTEAARAGHTVTPAADVLSGLGRLAFPDPRAAVEAALDEAEVLSLTEEPEFDEEAFGEDAEPPEPEETLGPARWALAEEAAAEGLRRLTLTAVPLLDDAAVKTLRDGLPEDRSLALTAALRTGVSILRGTPDGLARTAAGIADAAASRGVRTAIATPTDRAAADLAAADPALDAAAVTVTSLHRLLEPRDDPSAAPGAVVYGRGEQRPFDLDLVIVTDGAALDVELCAVLAEACPDGAHLVLCAEQGAPPPAAPGARWTTWRRPRRCPSSRSTPSRRPARSARWPRRCAAASSSPWTPPGGRSSWCPRRAPPRRCTGPSSSSPTRSPGRSGSSRATSRSSRRAAGGEAGAAALNAALKARLNPGPGAFRGMDPGDRVVVAAPLPHAPLGETGVVTGGGPDGLEVAFPAGAAVIAPADASRLRHGWAVPAALARGTRRPAVVAVLSGGGLTRPLVATAFGLALRHLSVVQAAGPALARAVREGGSPARRTRLGRLVVQ